MPTAVVDLRPAPHSQGVASPVGWVRTVSATTHR